MPGRIPTAPSTPDAREHMAQKPTPDAGKRSNPVAGASLQAGTNTDATDASYQDQRGNGGELHQTTTDRDARITTNHGVPISDNQNSLKGGMSGRPHGP